MSAVFFFRKSVQFAAYNLLINRRNDYLGPDGSSCVSVPPPPHSPCSTGTGPAPPDQTVSTRNPLGQTPLLQGSVSRTQFLFMIRTHLGP